MIPVVEMRPPRARGNIQHIGIDVAYGGPKARACRPAARNRYRRCAGHIEQRKRRVAARRIERVDHQVFPDRCRPADIRSFIRS